MDDYPVMDDYDYCPICGRYVGKIVRDIAYDASFGYGGTCEFECPSCHHALVAKFNWVLGRIFCGIKSKLQEESNVKASRTTARN